MKTEINTGLLSVGRIEQVSTIALVVGLSLLFQWWLEALYWLGLALLAIGIVGIFMSQVMQRNHLARILERMMVLGMMLGILGMLQAWQIWLYENGFYVLALSTLGFIVVSHIGSSDT